MHPKSITLFYFTGYKSKQPMVTSLWSAYIDFKRKGEFVACPTFKQLRSGSQLWNPFLNYHSSQEQKGVSFSCVSNGGHCEHMAKTRDLHYQICCQVCWIFCYFQTLMKRLLRILNINIVKNLVRYWHDLLKILVRTCQNLDNKFLKSWRKTG